MSNYAEFRKRGIPLVHQIAVSRCPGGEDVATLPVDAASSWSAMGVPTTLGITVGLLDEYGPPQRLDGRRGYLRDGQDAGRSQWPLR